ncbi:MAG: DNA topoisomerase (ATP-hydrolyzing) [Planctomycetaceae bacterium]
MARRKSSSNNNGQNLFSQVDALEEAGNVEFVPISIETRRRYLNYALSVITSRALPDVRDGLKPVQRRILYVMFDRLRLTADAKTRKCAKICGDTTGSFHPHGTIAVYETLVRMAQDFSLRYPLVIGQGNFGSIMGLRPAADRYTEAKLSALSEQLMNELRYRTVDMRPTYDAADMEPSVLPARFPALLVNGSQGIAVGMATSIPPHNLVEVTRACVQLIDKPDSTVAQLMKYVKGPDFPLGARIVTDRAELKSAYETGRGSIKSRGEWRFDTEGRREIKTRLIVYSVPYGVSTGPLITEIGELIEGRRIPQLLSVNDETNEENGLRIVLEIKAGADPEAVVAYLYKHTSLESNFGYNATALVPDEHGTLVPRVLSLKDLLQHFLDFRFETVRRRLEFQLEQLRKRIHILEGFAIIFDGLDLALKIIRASSGKKDAAEKLMAKFPLDELQTDAVLELALYKISQLEIDHIRQELADKRAEAARIEKLLKSKAGMWKLVRSELEEVAAQFGDKRRSEFGSSEEIVEFDPQAYIVRENTNVVVTADGWVKRVNQLASVAKTRVREGDSVLAVIPGSTLDNAVFFSSDGVAFTVPIDQIPVSSGYGEPLAKHARFADGASVVSALTTDPRFVEAVPDDSTEWGPLLLIATKQGQVMTLPFHGFRTPSTRSGRKYCRLRKGDEVVYCQLITDAETVFFASANARVLHFSLDDVPMLTNAGKGVRGIKLAPDDRLLGVVQMARPSDCLRAVNSNDKELVFGQQKYQVTSRGGRGVLTSKRTTFTRILQAEIELVDWATMEEASE